MEIRVVVQNPENRFSRIGWEQFILPRLASKLSPTVFHSTGNTLPPGMNCPMIVTMHDFQYHFYPENFTAMRRLYLQTVVPRSLRRAAAVACISETTKQHAMDLHKIPEKKLCVIYEAGLWPGERSVAASAEELRKKFDVASPILLSVGSRLPHKNIERLITAFGMIKDYIPQDLFIVGERFGHGDRIDKFVNEVNYGAKPRIHVIGFVSREDLLGFYQLADAFVFPSLFEGFGIPALEAMECGCPVITSNSTSLPEVAGDATERVNPLDVTDIARVLRKVCTDPELRLELKRRGFGWAKQFSWEKMGLETMKLYSSVAQHSQNLPA